MKACRSVTTISLLLLLPACNPKFSVGERLQDIVSANRIVVFSCERYVEVEESNNEGRIVKGLKVDGVRLIEVVPDRNLTNRMFFIVDQPVAAGLLRSRYLEKKRQGSRSASAPIRFLDYQSAWIIKVDPDGLISESRKKDFGHITMQLSDSAFPHP
jgi:hypothetical protein